MIIGISGFKWAGKGSIAKILMRHGFIKISCATPLKDIIAILFNWDRELLDGDINRKWREEADPEWQIFAGHGVFQNDAFISPRIAMERIGTNLFRNQVHQDLWLIHMQKRMKKIQEEYRCKDILLDDGTYVSFRGFVIDDARFLNELAICDITIRIVRFMYTDEEIEKMSDAEKAHLKHIFDITIANTGTLEDLYMQVETHILPILHIQA